MTRSQHLVRFCPALLIAAAACDSNRGPSSGAAFTPETDAVQSAGSDGPSAAERPGETAPAGKPGQAPWAPGTNATGPLHDGQIAAVLDALHAGEVAQAAVAREKSKSPQVRSYAATMLADHGDGRLPQPGVQGPRAESPLSKELASASREALGKLERASGAAFDRAYAEAMVSGHERALELVRRELMPRAQSSELQAHLEALVPRLEQHLARAEELQGALASAD